MGKIIIDTQTALQVPTIVADEHEADLNNQSTSTAH